MKRLERILFDQAHADLQELTAGSGTPGRVVEGQVLGLHDTPLHLIFALTVEPPAITAATYYGNGQARVVRLEVDTDDVMVTAANVAVALNVHQPAADQLRDLTVSADFTPAIAAPAIREVANNLDVFAPYAE